MKLKKSRQAGIDQPTHRAIDEGAMDEFYDSDTERASAINYERRREMWVKFNKGDWWIAVAVYLILSSFAVVIF